MQTSYGDFFFFNPDVHMDDYNVRFDGRNFFDQAVNNKQRTYDNIRKIANGREDDYIWMQMDEEMIGCLLDYHYFKDYYKVTIIDFSKQQVLDANPKAIQQVSFIGKLKTNAAIINFYSWRNKRNYFEFFTSNPESIANLHCFNIISIKMTLYNNVNVKLSNS